MRTKWPQWLNMLHYNETIYHDILSKAKRKDMNWFAKFLAQVDTNSFTIGHDGSTEWSLLYLSTSKLNHSCLPNATRDCGSTAENSDSEMIQQMESGKIVTDKDVSSSNLKDSSYIGKTYALRDIKKGEQIAISYLSRANVLCLPTNQRNSYITNTWNFICKCVRCNPK